MTDHPRRPEQTGPTWVSVSLALALFAAVPVNADPPRSGRPDDADLRQYLECSQIAEHGILSFGEAGYCSRVFLRIKLSLVPGMSLERFDSLPPEQKSTVNTLGYLRYLDWKKVNAAHVETLGQAIPGM